jgi:hypothetical protein
MSITTLIEGHDAERGFFILIVLAVVLALGNRGPVKRRVHTHARPGGFRAQPKITALKVLGWNDVSVLVRPPEVSTQAPPGGKRRYLPT